ncbi:SPOR domain-containing protein [Chromatiaceae bacterium AAb-1]|nr:SPOR domain-containing protein [Chromatiaceae bacterium AAb-1]
MPQKDYVKTSRAKPGSKPRARAKPASGSRARRAPAPASRRPWLLLTATALLLSCFIYFLWFLNKQPADTGTPPATAPVATAKKDELPPRPTEEPYQYIKELENKEIKVEVTEPQQRGPFQMQCGSFRQEQQAEAMKAQIAFSGFSSAIRRTESNNGIWYRVVLGPYESRRQATADRNRLRQQGINTCQIWNWT